ncbi:MAG TPA: hypothetical protein VHY80_01950, partial [Stellaceae bacterium]|nr:hypothetical protein [Stellaceae bacterium]
MNSERRLCEFARSALVAALCALTAGCATYHALPLPEKPNLATSLSQLQQKVPALGDTIIDIDPPLSLDSIGLLAVLNDPELRSEWGQIDVAQAQLVQASLLPNPSATLAYGALIGGPGTAASYAASISEDIAAL